MWQRAEPSIRGAPLSALRAERAARAGGGRRQAAGGSYLGLDGQARMRKGACRRTARAKAARQGAASARRSGLPCVAANNSTKPKRPSRQRQP